MIDIIWALMIILGVGYGIINHKLVEVSNSIIESSGQAVTLVISMIGVVALWCGLMEIAEKSGLIRGMMKLLSPIINLLFPNLNGEHGKKAKEYITTNFILNMLGTGWSATGPGLMAMEELYKAREEEAGGEKTKKQNVASTEMCTFVVLNISSLQLIPISIIAYRGAYDAVKPASIILPALITTAFSTLVGVIVCIGMARLDRRAG